MKQTHRPYIIAKHGTNKQNYQSLFKFLDILFMDIELFGEYKVMAEHLVNTLENNFSYLKKHADKMSKKIMDDKDIKMLFDDFQKQYDYNITNKTAMNNSKQLSRSTVMKQVYKHLNIKPKKQPKNS